MHRAMLAGTGGWRRSVEQAQGAFRLGRAARVSAPASLRGGPGSTEQGRRTRDRVLEVSVELISEVGIDQTRLAEIARRAGMSSGQVMYYFTSKEHILLEALAWREHEDNEHARALLRKIDGAWRRLGRFIGLYLPTTPVNPAWLLWIEAWARAPHHPEVGQFLDELMRPWREILAEIIESGVREGAFDPPAEMGEFTIRFCALLDGLAMTHLRQMPNLSRKRVAEFAMNAARAELTAGHHRPSPA